MENKGYKILVEAEPEFEEEYPNHLTAWARAEALEEQGRRVVVFDAKGMVMGVSSDPEPEDSAYKSEYMVDDKWVDELVLENLIKHIRNKDWDEIGYGPDFFADELEDLLRIYKEMYPAIGTLVDVYMKDRHRAKA